MNDSGKIIFHYSAIQILNQYLLLELFPKAENMFGRKGSLVYRFLGGKHVGSLEGSEWRRHRKVKQHEFIINSLLII